MTSTNRSKNTYGATCGNFIEGVKSFSFTVTATIADMLELSTTFSESVATGSHILDAPPHDGTGSGFIEIGAVYTVIYYETGWKYACGRKENIEYHLVKTNAQAETVSVKACVHE